MNVIDDGETFKSKQVNLVQILPKLWANVAFLFNLQKIVKPLLAFN